MSQVTDSKAPYQKTVEFLKANVHYIWILLAANFIFSVYVLLSLSDTINRSSNEMKHAALQISKGVVMLDVIGRPIVVAPERFAPVSPAFKNVIINYIKMNAIYDWADIVNNNFNEAVYNVKELISKNPEILEFRNHFFKKGSQAEKDFYGYLTKLVFSLNQGKLPERISIVEQRVVKFRVDEDQFEMLIDFKVLASIFDGNTEKYLNKEGHITFDVGGVLDPSVSTPDNPIGLLFTTKFKPTILEK